MKTRIYVSMLVIALTAALIGGATMALFTDTAANTGNSFAAGTVDITVGATDVIVGAANMAPGDTRTGSFVVRNAGSLELRFSVSAVGAGDLFSGATPATIGGLGNDQNIVLAPNASATVTFDVILPLTAGNAYQGDGGTVDLTISAVQTANNALPQ